MAAISSKQVGSRERAAQEPAPIATSLKWRPRSGTSQRNRPFDGNRISRPQGAVVLRELSTQSELQIDGVWEKENILFVHSLIIVRNYAKWAAVSFIKGIKFPLCKVQIDKS
jgi:hypothetical protein